MNSDDSNGALAIAAGVFLILYDALYLFAAVRMIGSWDFDGISDVVLCLIAFLLLAAAVLLFLRKAKIAALMISVVTIVAAINNLPLAAEILSGTITVEHSLLIEPVTESISRWIAAYPVGEILSWLLFSLALFLRGNPALILAVASAVASAVSCVASFFLMAYYPGHPSPFSLWQGLFIFAALLAGLWLYSLGRAARKSREEDGSGPL